MPVQNKLNFLIVLILTTGILNSNYILANDVNSIKERELIAQKSGGRSGGGSFNRPSGSSSKGKSTPKRSNYNQFKSTPSSYRREPSRTYQDLDQNRQRTSTNNTYNRPRNGSIFGLNELLFLIIFLFAIALIIYLIYQTISNLSRSTNRIENKINREIDNDLVTVSMLQVALSSTAENIQQELIKLSLSVDTNTELGLVQLMQESALILLRNSHAWTHVLSSSNSLNINHAEPAFNKLSITERSKFSSELSNIDGNLKTEAVSNSNSEDFGSYVVVTLILGTAHDQPLFPKINTEETLKEAILQLSSMLPDYLIKLELLWTPQPAAQYLSEEELLLEYSNMIPFV